MFIEAPILRHFDPECQIRIETDTSGYAIGGVLSQLNSDWVASDDSKSDKSDFGQWHPVAYFSRKMIPAKTQYETHDAELLAIVEAFKTWRHYLECCKHEVLVPINHNNLRQFINTKSFSSCQVQWAQELLRYHFRIDYRQGKANRGIDALSRFPQRSSNEEKKLQAKNTQIFQRLQTSLTNASLSGLSLTPDLSPLYQALICGTYVRPQLREFWTNLRAELADECFYQASIGGMRLRLPELQESDKEVRSIRAAGELQDGYEEIDGVLHYQGQPFVPEVIRTKIISQYHDDPLAGYFGVDKTRELIGQKYYWLSLRKDVESYIKGYDVSLSSKTARHKPYDDLQLLHVPTH